MGPRKQQSKGQRKSPPLSEENEALGVEDKN